MLLCILQLFLNFKFIAQYTSTDYNNIYKIYF